MVKTSSKDNHKVKTLPEDYGSDDLDLEGFPEKY